jgi:hypothetical protein
MRPDLLSKTQQAQRPDVRLLDSNPNQHARDILTEKGVIGNKTALLDQVTGSYLRDLSPSKQQAQAALEAQ